MFPLDSAYLSQVSILCHCHLFSCISPLAFLVFLDDDDDDDDDDNDDDAQICRARPK